MTVSVAVMAHPKRAGFVPELVDALDRPATVVWDDGSNSRWGTGRRALLAYDPAASHHCVVQDDAVVPRDLIAGVEQALAYTPGDVPVCLYTGKVRPYREMVREYVARAEGTASWLVMDQLNWGVGIVFPTRHIEAMVAWCDNQSIPNYDSRMSRWFESHGIETWYPYPSLVDHRESPSLVEGRGHAGRVAHRFIGADASALDTDYSGSVLRLPNVSDYRPGGTMLFYCEKYANYSIPTIGAHFEGHFFEATTRQQISYLQNAFMRRRGIRPATAAEVAAWRAEAAPVEQPPGTVKIQEPAPVVPPEGTVLVAVGPAGGTAQEVLEWVGDDPARAAAALAAEAEREKPRKTLAGKLEVIAEG